MAEMSTTVRSESLASASEIDYFDWLESHLENQATLDLAALNEHEGSAQYRLIEQPTEVADDGEIDNQTLRNELEQGKGFVRRMLGRAAAHANYTVVQGYQVPGLIGEKDRALHEKYAREDGDGPITRVRKYFGRNAIRMYGGFVAGTAATIYGASIVDKYDHAFHDFWDPTINNPNPNTNPIVEASVPYRTAEVNLMGAQATDIYVGGHTQGDPLASGYMESVKTAGIYNENNKNVPIFWSAQMAPVSGDAMPMTMSDAEGASQIVDAINQANGAPVRVVAFSQGTEALARAMQEVANQPGNNGRVPDNITVIYEGTPSGDIGLGKSRYVGAVSPVLNALGLETQQPLPPGAHVIVRTDVADVFGNGGNQSGAKLLEMAMGPGHRVVGPDNGVLLYNYEKDGVTYEVYGDPQGVDDPLLRIARDNGIPISPQAEAFMEALIPTTPPGATQPVYANASDVSRTFGEMIDAGTGNTGIAERSVDAIMAIPGTHHDLQTYLDLEKTPDRFAHMAADPSSIPTELPKAMDEVKGAMDTTMEYLQNPNKGVDMINSALNANGVGFLKIPHFDTTPRASAPVHQSTGINLNEIIKPVQKAIAQAAPTASAEVHTNVNVPVAPLPTEIAQPIADAVPQIAEPVQQIANQFNGVVNQFLKGFKIPH